MLLMVMVFYHRNRNPNKDSHQDNTLECQLVILKGKRKQTTFGCLVNNVLKGLHHGRDR